MWRIRFQKRLDPTVANTADSSCVEPDIRTMVDGF
jgi:hypothetical protein